MTYPQTLLQVLLALVNGLQSRRRTQLLMLFLLMFLGALAEVVSLGSIIPFLAILVDPDQALQKNWVAKVVDKLGLANSPDIRWHLTLIFASAVIVSGVVRFALLYAIAKLNYGIGHELGSDLYRRTLHQPYEVQVSRNSSEILANITKIDEVVWLAFSLLNTASAIVMALFIVGTLVLIDPLIATIALLGFGTIYVIVSFSTRAQLAKNSKVISEAYGSRVQTMQEALGGIRDILLDQSQPIFLRRFNVVDWSLRQAQASNYIIGPGPRFAVEALGMMLIAFLGYKMTSSGGGIVSAIPTLGALALGAQRLMPMLQQIYQGWANIAGSKKVISDVFALLQQPVDQQSFETQGAKLLFQREIRFEQVSFRYQSKFPLVIDQLSLNIPRGARVGFLGTTGSGKSTLMDLLMGLLQPETGQIFVDNSPLTGIVRLAWQRNVAHVPQAIFLADASFSENIAFGVPVGQIDMDRIRHAASRAQISEFIESSALGYAAVVGERGLRLSGGQRQRIGIARALYKNSTVLVFDEATSALDSETEKTVMQAIEGLGRDLTIVLIAHRLTTLQGCDIIYRLENGRLVSSGSYETIIATDHTKKILDAH